MELSDALLVSNQDWDPAYLKDIILVDFYEMSEMWCSSSDIADQDLVNFVEKVDKYSPIVEDISLEDDVLCQAVEQIEDE